ncbi:MAG: DNA alkylation repair protein [Bacteroidaceae bacterium]|nr:DNA alkylation repair protein [Bacteroidaceae bacterium]
MLEQKELMRAVKTELRLAMNGVASARMRESGFNYTVNFGVELPRLQTIADEQRKEILEQGGGEEDLFRLAQTLWMENIRESKILACMLMPTEAFTYDLAELWVEQIPNIEIARLMVMYLLVRLPFAIDMAFRWIASERDWHQVCGFLLIARMLINGTEFSERTMDELRDQTLANIQSQNAHVAKAANTVLAFLEAS